ncbi:adaptive-response sensory-kinase SasA [Deinococcus carri]|uniref:histidine kinase n=1 Tax=Deinococcus carri TaxID=1211323 RepID=A0ABP9W5Y2_9DEIO
MNPDLSLSFQPGAQTLLDGLLDPLFVVDGQWRYTYVNPPAAALVGRPPEDLLGRVLWSCFPGMRPGALDPDLESEFRRVMQTRQGQQFELSSPALALWAEVWAFPQGDGLAVHFRNVRESKLTEARRGALLEMTLTLASAGCAQDAVQAVLRLSEAALGASGGTVWRQEEDGLVPWQSVGDGEWPAQAPPLAGVLAQPDGLFLPLGTLTLAAVPLGLGEQAYGVLTLRFGGGWPLGAAERGFVRLLAAQLAQTLDRLQAAETSARALAELGQERARLSAILDQLPAAVWIAELPEGRIITGNRAIERILGVPFVASQGIGEYSEYLGFHPDGRRYQGHEWPLARTVLTGECVENEEIEMQRVDGTRSFVQYSSALIRDERGDPDLAVVTGVDVSELRELRHRLEQRVETRTRDLLRRNEELAAETAALQAFANFTELVGQETERGVLTRAAASVLQHALGEGSTGYYERAGDLWKQGPWAGDMTPGTLAAAQEGFPAELPLFAQPATTQQPLFVEDWRSSDHALAPHTPEYGAIGIYPVTVQGHTVGQLAAGLREKTRWNERDRAVFRAVGRALSLAAERVELAQMLSVQKDELAARTSALEAFAELGRDLGLHSDPQRLVRRAQEILLARLPAGYALYSEPEEDSWHVRAQVGELGSAAWQAEVEAGLPADTPHLAVPWQSGEPLYQTAGEEPGLDTLPHIAARAALPVRVGGAPRGVLVVALFRQEAGGARPWTRTERVILETVTQSLGLALERAEGQRALAAQQRQLEQANHDLEAFASTVSHDLRAPVRHMGSFAGMLRRVVPEDARALRYVDVIEQSAARMNTLIESLLTFARLGTGELQKTDVSLNALVEAVRAELASETGERQIDWRVGPLPVVRGDVTLLRQVVQNLLGNAVKYSRTRDTAVLEVWGETAGHEHRIHVRDNGVGFEPAQHERLFEIFKRLHRPEDFEGEGVGLASVQRIVARHGGRVWAEGRPSEGATFTFTLPVA